MHRERPALNMARNSKRMAANSKTTSSPHVIAEPATMEC
jgi:hypothetical protein